MERMVKRVTSLVCDVTDVEVRRVLNWILEPQKAVSACWRRGVCGTSGSGRGGKQRSRTTSAGVGEEGVCIHLATWKVLRMIYFQRHNQCDSIWNHKYLFKNRTYSMLTY